MSKQYKLTKSSPQFVGIIAVNAAAIKPLFSSKRWLASSKGGSAPPESETKNSHPLVTIGSATLNSRNRRRSLNYTDIDNSSEEHIFKPDLSHHQKGHTKISASTDLERNNSQAGYSRGITVTTQVDIDDGKHKQDV